MAERVYIFVLALLPVSIKNFSWNTDSVRDFPKNITLSEHNLTANHSIPFLRLRISKFLITYFRLLRFCAVKFMSAGSNNVSSISTISTSPDWISAAPSHDIIIGMQSAPVEQFSGVWNQAEQRKKKKKAVLFMVKKEIRRKLGN